MKDEEDTHKILIEVPTAWLPEMERAAKRRFTSRHGWILSALRRVLDGDKR